MSLGGPLSLKEFSMSLNSFLLDIQTELFINRSTRKSNYKGPGFTRHHVEG